MGLLQVTTGFQYEKMVYFWMIWGTSILGNPLIYIYIIGIQLVTIGNYETL